MSGEPQHVSDLARVVLFDLAATGLCQWNADAGAIFVDLAEHRRWAVDHNGGRLALDKLATQARQLEALAAELPTLVARLAQVVSQ